MMNLFNKVKYIVAFILVNAILVASVACSDVIDPSETIDSVPTENKETEKNEDVQPSTKFRIYKLGGKYFVEVDSFEYYLRSESQLDGSVMSTKVGEYSVDEFCEAMEKGEMSRRQLGNLCKLYGARGTGISMFNPNKFYVLDGMEGAEREVLIWHAWRYELVYPFVTETDLSAVVRLVAYPNNGSIITHKIEEEIEKRAEYEEKGYHYLSLTLGGLRAERISQNQPGGNGHYLLYHYNSDIDLYYELSVWSYDSPISEEFLSSIRNFKFKKIELTPYGLDESEN